MALDRPLLALELSSAASSLALSLPDGAVRGRDFGGERGRALLAQIDALLEDCGLRPDEIAAVVVGTGPGSYTGLRIACAGARSLGYALGVPTGGLCSFEAAALDAPAGSELHLVLDAYRREVYHACYRREAEDVVALTAPRVLPREETAAALPEGALVLGDPALLGDAAPRFRFLAEAVEPRAEALLELARRRGADAWTAAEPLYLRAAR